MWPIGDGLLGKEEVLVPVEVVDVTEDGGVAAIEVHGAAGVSEDTVLARMYSWQRAMRIFDGPDEVHLRTIARSEIGREKSAFAAAVT